MRGRQIEGTNDPSNDRITPACAGKTPRSGKGAGLSADHPRLRGEDTSNPTYIHARSLSWPTSSFTLFLVTQENDSPLSFSASPKFFHTTISLLAPKCNCFVYFYQEFSYVSPKTIPFVPLFFDFIWYNREQRLGAFPRPLYSIFKKG